MSVEDRLRNRPVEPDTRILSQSFVKLGDWDGLMELWNWEGITASSVILLREQIGGVSDAEVVDRCLKTVGAGGEAEYTLKEIDGYVFFNFGFKTD